MREHTNLPAVVGFMGEHVAEHLWAERFREHLLAAGGALRQGLASLLCRAVHPAELRGNLEVRCCQPEPFGSDVVHVREDRRNRADLAGRFSCPYCRIELFDEELVRPIIGGKNAHGRSAELTISAGMLGHGSLLRDLS